MAKVMTKARYLKLRAGKASFRPRKYVATFEIYANRLKNNRAV